MDTLALFQRLICQKLRRKFSMPSNSTEHRKLAAIMFTDMVGYSALSQRNEALALELIQEHQQVLRSVFPKHQGQEIKSTGDGFLVEFASALAAVQCAVEIQKLMRQRNEGRSAERRVLIRIGIHLGDVVRRENDVFGDGVNIAARIEPLAEPGGVCVSRAVYEQIENKIEHSLVQLSKPSLKNIQATVEVYRLLIDEPRVARPAPQAKSRSGIPVVSVVVVLVVAVVIVFLKSRSRSATSAQEAKSSAATNMVATHATNTLPLLEASVRLLHSFGPTNTEAVNGWGKITLASDGFLYGCATKIGPGGAGSIYRVRTNGADYAVLHSFDWTNNGAEPTGGVIEGRDGAIYGTTFRGGEADAGTIFRIAKDGSDFRVLHHFKATGDCRYPQSELLHAHDGRIYGTATAGGGQRLGGVFRIATDGTGYSITTDFYHGQPDDPRQPVGGLIQLPEGAMFGTTKFGGVRNHGTVFRLDANGKLVAVRSLNFGTDGLMQPEGTLLRASDGMLYGTCTLGGAGSAGGVFRLSPDGSGFTVVRAFELMTDARQPSAGLVEAADGSLLGTSMLGGEFNKGAVFRITKDGSGHQTLHSFAGPPNDAARPRSPLAAGAPGLFYSATLIGGSKGYGAVYELAIPALARSATNAAPHIR